MECTGLAAAATAALALVRRWRQRAGGGRADREVARLQSQVARLRRQLREGRAAWRAQETRLEAQLQGRVEDLRRALLAAAGREAQTQASTTAKPRPRIAAALLGSRACSVTPLQTEPQADTTVQILPSLWRGGLPLGRQDAEGGDAFEFQLDFTDRDCLTEAVLSRTPALAQLDWQELMQRLAVFDASGLLLPLTRSELPSTPEAYPMRVRYARPQVRVANPRQRGVRLGKLLEFFEGSCGDVAFEDGEQGMLAVCMPTKLACLCNRQNIRACQQDGAGNFRELQPNMYAVESLLLRPLTEPERLSAAEVWSPEGATISVFVSHFWGEDFGEFVQSTYRFVLIDLFARNPKLGRAEVYQRAMQVGLYICAFSNNQWNLKSEMGSRVEESPFYKVLKADSTTTVVMNLDQMANSLLRAWCDFEFYFSHVLQKNTALNCRYGPLRRLGCTSSESSKVAEIWMLHVFELLQDVDIRRATASNPGDLAMIQAEIESFKGTGCAQGLAGAEALNRLLKSMIASEVLPALARLGNLPAVELALQNGADVEAADQRQIRPLTYAAAAYGPDSPVARRLLAQGADERALAHAAVVVDLFSEDSRIRQAALKRIKTLFSRTERRFHQATLRLATEKHLAHCTSLLKALAQLDENVEANLSVDCLASMDDIGKSENPTPVPSSVATPAEVSPEKDCNRDVDDVNDSNPVVSEQASNTSLMEDGMQTYTVELVRRASAALRSETSVPTSARKGRHTESASGRCGGSGDQIHPCRSRGLLQPGRRAKNTERHSAALSNSSGGQLNVPVIVQHLSHEDSNLRLAACEVLGDLGEEGMHHAPQLVERLGDEDEAVRLVALSALTRVGGDALDPEHVAPVAELLEDESAEVREAACEALASLGEAPSVPKAVCEGLASTLSDASADVRLAAVEALASLGPEVAVPHAPHIANLLTAEEPEEVVAALGALAQIGEEAADHLPSIAECLEHDDWRVRQAACEAVVVMGAPAEAHAPELAGLLQDHDSDVRCAACTALAQLGGEAAAEHAPELASRLSDGDAEVRGAAAGALAQLGEAAIPHARDIVECLADPSIEVRRIACEALGQLGDERTSDALHSRLSDQDGSVQEAAAVAIAELSSTSVNGRGGRKESDYLEAPLTRI